MSKSNWKFLIFTFLSLLLIYTRIVNIGWGLPYPMHPDERNMAVAVQSLNCKISNFEFRISNFRECGNPHFFAYGQFPLYLGYGGIQLMKFVSGDLGMPISFQEAIISLRMISAIASIITAIVFYKIILFLSKKATSYKLQATSFLILIFSPVLIQFAHFGTTESLLMLFYSSIIYLSLLFIQKKLLTTNYLLLTSLISGLALATKVSSVLYLIIPCIVLFLQMKKKSITYIVVSLSITSVFFILFSPHTIISFKEFTSSMNYESGVALGQPMVFYTRQFDHTIPIIFQITKIFPYALGWPVFVLGGLGFLGISWRKKEYNLLRFAFILVLLPNAFMYAKWTRFIAPSFPLMIIFAILLLSKIKISRLLLCILAFIIIIPGIAYLSIYQNQDVRFQATDWINKNIPIGAKILSETANVVDIPLDNKGYRVISFNFYDLDTDKHLQEDLVNFLPGADYIFVPSRRIFKNLSPEYPILNDYYQRLFSGILGFKQVAEFTSYPQLKFQILNFKFQMEFPDENAEETWTVFDHPVIRIYKRI